MSQAHIRISLTAGDLELEGSEEFVAQYGDAIQGLLGRLRQPAAPGKPGGTGVATTPVIDPPAGEEPREFGEVLHALPNSASGADQILIAGSYAQQSSTENSFSTGEANQLLLGQGVKLSNPSQSLKNCIAAKRVFKVGSRYRISKTGEEHLKALISH